MSTTNVRHYLSIIYRPRAEGGKRTSPHSLCLIILESQTAFRVDVLLPRFGGTLDGAIGDDNAAAGPAVAHDPQGVVAHALHQFHVSLGEAEDAAVIVVQDHHGR